MNARDADCECLYCGKRWVKTFSYGWSRDPDECTRCGDRNIRMTERSEMSGDAFGYRYGPPEQKNFKKS